MKKMPGLILAAVLLCATQAARADDFSDDQFCAASNDAAKALQASGPQWADKVTRSDGMAVDCPNKGLTYRKYVKMNAADLGDNWQDQMQEAWNQTYCQDPSIGPALQNGWTVTVSVTLQDGTQQPFTVNCGQ